MPLVLAASAPPSHLDLVHTGIAETKEERQHFGFCVLLLPNSITTKRNSYQNLDDSVRLEEEDSSSLIKNFV